MSISDLLGWPAAYKLWQLPFQRQKMAPVARSRPPAPLRVLELGCGPGLNIPFFKNDEYLGIDIEPRYVAAAEAECGRNGSRHKAILGDCSNLGGLIEGSFDVILANSLLHHLSDEEVVRTLEGGSARMAAGGTLQVVDLVIDDAGSRVGNWLAMNDRGRFPRTTANLVDIISRQFEVMRSTRFNLQLGGLGLWNMIHIIGHRREG